MRRFTPHVGIETTRAAETAASPRRGLRLERRPLAWKIQSLQSVESRTAFPLRVPSDCELS